MKNIRTALLLTTASIIPGCKMTDSFTKDTVPHNINDVVANLGNSYNSLSQSLNTSATCVTGTEVTVTPSRSETSMEVNQSTETIMKEFSGEVEGTPRLSFLNLNTQGGFFRSLSQSDHNLAMIFSTTINKGGKKLDAPKLNPEFAAMSDIQVLQDCGDSYVAQINEGGRITISATLSFAEETTRKKWQNISQINTPWAKASADIKDKAEEQGMNGSLYVKILQEGGTPEAAPMASRTCPLKSKEDVQLCLEAIDQAMDYAKNDFPTQVAANPTILNYQTRKLSDLVGFSGANLVVPAEVLKNRSNLKSALDQQSELFDLIQKAEANGFTIPAKIKTAVDQNIATIKQAADHCFDYSMVTATGPVWGNCSSASQSLQLLPVERAQVFMTPDSVKANDILGSQIVNLYQKPITVSVRVDADATWVLSNGGTTETANYEGKNLNCDDRCPVRGAPEGSMVINSDGQFSTLRHSDNQYTIYPGEALSLQINDSYFDLESNSGSIPFSWICTNCEGMPSPLGGTDGLISEVIIQPTSEQGSKFRNRQQTSKTYEINAYGTWTNGKFVIGSTQWSGAEGQVGTACGESCQAPSLPTGALLAIIDGEVSHIDGSGKVTLAANETLTLKINDSTGSYNNNDGLGKAYIRCIDCQ